jgi:hypothetical protein
MLSQSCSVFLIRGHRSWNRSKSRRGEVGVPSCDHHEYPLDGVTTFLARFGELWGTSYFVDFMAPSVAHYERFWRYYARYEPWPWDRGPRGRFAPRCSRSTGLTSRRLCACPF